MVVSTVLVDLYAAAAAAWVPLSKASLSVFNTSAEVGPCFLYIANNPFIDWSLASELVIGPAEPLIFPAMLVLVTRFFFLFYTPLMLCCPLLFHEGSIFFWKITL